MLGDQLGHFEHAYRLFAAEDLLQLLVGVDVALVLGILQAVFLDVFPQLLHYF